MKKTFTFIFLACLSLCLLACDSSKTIQTIDLTDGNPSQVITIDVSKGDSLSIWNSIDIEYSDDFDLQYTLDMQLNSKAGVTKTIDGTKPSIKMMSKNISINGNCHTSWQTGKILSGITISEDGILKIKITPEIKGKNLNVIRNAIQIKKS